MSTEMKEQLQAMSPEDLKEIHDEMTECVGGEEAMAHLADITLCLGVLGAVARANTFDILLLAQQLHIDKSEILPVEAMFEIVVDKLPRLLNDGLIDFNGITEEGLEVHGEHEQALSSMDEEDFPTEGTC